VRLVTFTNLFPSALRPTHGLFVAERARRLATALGEDLSEGSWRVVVPVPRVPGLLRRRAEDKLLAALPEREDVLLADGRSVPVRHVHYLHLPGMSLRAQARRIVRACLPVVREEVGCGPALLDAHYVYPDGVAALEIANEIGVPCFVTARGSDLNVVARQPFVRDRIQDLAPSAAGLFAVSEPLRRRFVEIAGVEDDAVELARNGVDLERFRPGDEVAARRALGLPEGVPLVLGVGRLVADKGFLTTARALQKMTPSVRFVVVGDGPLREELSAMLPAERLHLLGARPPADVVTAMQACDLLAFPSVREGWPNVVTESLACGLPVVATPVGAVPQMLSSPFVGALVRVDDAEALGREIVRFLQRPPSRERVRAHAEQFGWQEPIERLATRARAAVRVAFAERGGERP
jgi:teichuronic acid biosynthesis glycosyltransferase TuaC